MASKSGRAVAELETEKSDNGRKKTEMAAS